MTYEDVLNNVRGLLNDQSNGTYTDAVLLVYLNMALRELQELFELNNVPVTNETSAVIDVPAGEDVIAFSATLPSPSLPSNLIEIQKVWCSQDGQENWVPVTKKEYLTQDELSNGTELSFFDVYAWMGQEIRLLASNTDLDVKIDYIRYLFPTLTEGDLGDDLTVLNSMSFLQFRAGSLAADFIAENEERANKLNGFAVLALDRVLGISAKGKQNIQTRRRPFRFGFKRRQVIS